MTCGHGELLPWVVSLIWFLRSPVCLNKNKVMIVGKWIGNHGGLYLNLPFSWMPSPDCLENVRKWGLSIVVKEGNVKDDSRETKEKTGWSRESDTLSEVYLASLSCSEESQVLSRILKYKRQSHFAFRLIIIPLIDSTSSSQVFHPLSSLLRDLSKTNQTSTWTSE
jgi:hypothetical protein